MSIVMDVQNLNCANVLNNINLKIFNNTFNVLTGSNGSGKSLFIKCLSNQIKYTGNIFFKNNLILSNEESLKKIGIVTSDSILLTGNVLYNMMFPLLNLGYTFEEAKKKSYSLSKKLNIEDLLLIDIQNLSIIEYKIVLFAVTVIYEPELLIIDESYDDLDLKQREKIISYMKNLKKCTILFVTKNSEDILLSDNLIVFSNGKIVFYDSTQKALTEEKLFTSNSLKMPFIVELSNKLISYNLINKIYLNKQELVNNIWK